MCLLRYCPLCGLYWRRQFCTKYEYYRAGCNIHKAFDYGMEFEHEPHMVCLRKSNDGTLTPFWQTFDSRVSTPVSIASSGTTLFDENVHLNNGEETELVSTSLRYKSFLGIFDLPLSNSHQ